MLCFFFVATVSGPNVIAVKTCFAVVVFVAVIAVVVVAE